MHWSHSSDNAPSKAEGLPPTPILVAYAMFLTSAAVLYHAVVSDELSAILTIAEMMQCLAVSLLCVQVLITGSVAGISARAVGMDALALCFRLSSTTWLNGYLPVDASGDWWFQAVDVFAVGMNFWLLYKVLGQKNRTYQADADTFPLTPIVIGALILAAIFHADMNARPLFDTFWMAGLFLRSVAVMPQLWLITRTGGKVEALMSHHIAVMALGRLLSGVFMWHAREDITCVQWVGGVNHAILAILTAHLLHLLLLGDFAYYYVKAVATQGLACRLDLEGLANYV